MLGESLAKVRSMVGELTITGEPDGADVTVNGQSVGKLPLAGPLHLGKGEIEVELRAPGYEHASKTVSLAGGTPESVSIVLARTSPPPDRPVATVATAPPSVRAADAASTAAPAATTIIAPAQGTEPVSGTPSSALRPVAWVAGGVGVAGLAFGVIETLVMTDKQNAFNNHTAPSPTPTDPNRRLPDCTTANLTTDCSQLRDSYQSARTLAIIGYVAGAALTATSAVLFVLSRPSPETRVGLTAACVPTLDTPGVSCLLRF